MTEGGRECRPFPQGFKWGAATAAHQIEGGNVNNDWWAFEHTPGSGCREPSGDACDSWERWKEDAELVAKLGLDHYRFSVEWSRIEPVEDEISNSALAHYRRQCIALQERGVEPIITFHHFTTPIWLTERGGWETDYAVERFGRYCTIVAETLGDVMAGACTINEPNNLATMGWHVGLFPPGKRDEALSRSVAARIVRAHRVAVEAIRAAAPGTPVGLALSMTDYQPVTGGDEMLRQIRHDSEDIFLDAVHGDDFLGVQAYSRMLIGPNGWIGPEPGVPVLDLGYEFYPASLGNCLRRASEYTAGSIALWVTENGIGTSDDALRIDYLHEALSGLLDAIQDGVDVRGYSYWSLLDNYEWIFGYRPKFGLFGVDRTTFYRSPKPSAVWLSSVVKANALPVTGGAGLHDCH
jgi:beta-glucosidase